MFQHQPGSDAAIVIRSVIGLAQTCLNSTSDGPTIDCSSLIGPSDDQYPGCRTSLYPTTVNLQLHPYK